MALSATLVLGGAVLVAAAAREGALWEVVREGTGSRIDVVADVAVVVAVGTLGAVAAAFLLYRATGMGAKAGSPVRANLSRTVAPTAVGVTVVGLTLIAMTRLAPDELPRVAGAEEDPAEETEGSQGILEWLGGLMPTEEGLGGDPGAGPEARPEAVLSPAAGMAILVILALAGLLGARWWSRHPPPLDDEPGTEVLERERRAMGGTVVGTIEAMLADPDPGTAIRGAYARLLEGLEARARGRRPHEGPMEHLGRVLGRLDVRSEPIRELVELFELARFSPHPLDGSHRDRALRALREVARDLGAPAPPPELDRTGSAPDASNPERRP